MGLLMVVLSLIFMSDHVITECKYITSCNLFIPTKEDFTSFDKVISLQK